jgi:hypothetical protein
MDDIRERNRKIFRLASDGIFHSKIANAFKLSPSRIRIIVRKINWKNATAERRKTIAQAMYHADDLDKFWPVSDMVVVLNALTVTSKALLEHFASLQKEQISLREIMDMAIPETDESSSPLYRITFIGKKGYWSIVNGLSAITFNERCNAEWDRKLVRLRRSLMNSGYLEYAPDGPWLRGK